jgi:hypothetical protein
LSDLNNSIDVPPDRQTPKFVFSRDHDDERDRPLKNLSESKKSRAKLIAGLIAMCAIVIFVLIHRQTIYTFLKRFYKKDNKE